MAAEDSPTRSVPIATVLALPSVAALFERLYDGELVQQYQQMRALEQRQQHQRLQQQAAATSVAAAALHVEIMLARARTVVRALFNSSLLEIRHALGRQMAGQSSHHHPQCTFQIIVGIEKTTRGSTFSDRASDVLFKCQERFNRNYGLNIVL
jgi:hypothetical protein